MVETKGGEEVSLTSKVKDGTSFVGIDSDFELDLMKRRERSEGKDQLKGEENRRVRNREAEKRPTGDPSSMKSFASRTQPSSFAVFLRRARTPSSAFSRM